MPDGAAAPRIGDPADERALAADGRLIRSVRWRLVLWSGLTTLVVLAVLGIGLYLSAANTLEVKGVALLSGSLHDVDAAAVLAAQGSGVDALPPRGFVHRVIAAPHEIVEQITAATRFEAAPLVELDGEAG